MIPFLINLQVMAIIVIGLGILMVIPFHVVVREKNTVLKKLKWYRWLLKPDFYLVSTYGNVPCDIVYACEL